MKPDKRTLERAWQRARATSDHDATRWRKDQCGAWIRWDHFGDVDSEFGWKIEDTQPGKMGQPAQLRPFHHANSFDIANDRAHCKVTADRGEAGPGASLDEPRNRPV